MPYPEEAVAPLRKELTDLNIQELRSSKEVDDFIISNKGTALVIINSICGCAAHTARPAIKQALQSQHLPDKMATVFAGQDLEATEQLRSHIKEYPPSSPAIVLFKNKNVIFMLQRQDILNHESGEVSQRLQSAFKKYC